MATITNKGDYIKVVNTDEEIHLYLKTDVLPDVVDNKFVIIEKSTGNVLESFTFVEVTDPESNSNDQLLDEVLKIIVGAGAVGELDGYVNYISISISKTLPNSATINITSSHYFQYFLFNDTTVEEIRIGIIVPDDFDNTVNPELIFKVSPADNQDTISSKTFKFQGDFKYVSEGENIKKTDDESLTVVVAVDTLYENITEAKFILDSSKITKSDLIGLKFSRLATDPQDNRNSDAQISSIGFYYKRI